jgi:Ca2+-transporting ATPase
MLWKSGIETGAKMVEWYRLETQEAIHQIHSDLENGLTAAEAARRIAEHGPNELVERAGKGSWAILWEQFTGIMVVMLIISAVVSVILGETIDAIVIMVIVIINAVLGFVQEYRAEQAMAALKRMAVPHVRVRRDGHLQEVTALSLVPGDIIQLETGNTVPADARLLDAANLRVQEAVLTGDRMQSKRIRLHWWGKTWRWAIELIPYIWERLSHMVTAWPW